MKYLSMWFITHVIIMAHPNNPARQRLSNHITYLLHAKYHFNLLIEICGSFYENRKTF